MAGHHYFHAKPRGCGYGFWSKRPPLLAALLGVRWPGCQRHVRASHRCVDCQEVRNRRRPGGFLGKASP